MIPKHSRSVAIPTLAALSLSMLLAVAACAPTATAPSAEAVVAVTVAAEAPTAIGEATGDSKGDAVVKAGPKRLTPQPEATQPALETATLTDAVIGYAIDYPATWFAYPSPGNVSMIASFDMDAEVGQGGVPSDMAKIDIVPDPSGGPEGLDAMASRVRSDLQVTSEFEVELSGGRRAIRIEGSGEMVDRTVLLLTEINGHDLLMEGYGDLSLFDTIAASLRPGS